MKNFNRIILFLALTGICTVNYSQATVRILKKDSTILVIEDDTEIKYKPTVISMGMSMKKMKEEASNPTNQFTCKSSREVVEIRNSEVLFIHIDSEQDGVKFFKSMPKIETRNVVGYGLSEVLLWSETHMLLEHPETDATQKFDKVGLSNSSMVKEFYENGEKVSLSGKDLTDWIDANFGGCEAIKKYTEDGKIKNNEWDKMAKDQLKNCFTAPY